MNAFNLNIREYKRKLDGKIDSITLENGQVFGSDTGEIEDNKAVTITENGEVEITPSEGKDAMKKVTATINIPIPGGNYLWGVAPASSPSITVPNDFTFLAKGEHSLGEADFYPNSVYINGKKEASDFSVNESVTIVNPAAPYDSITLKIVGKSGGTVIGYKEGVGSEKVFQLSRTAVTVATALETFARFDNVENPCKFECLNVTENNTFKPANAATGFGYVNVNVPKIANIAGISLIAPEVNVTKTVETTESKYSNSTLILCFIKNNGEIVMPANGEGSINELAFEDIKAGTATKFISYFGNAEVSTKIEVDIGVTGSTAPIYISATPTSIGSSVASGTQGFLLLALK